MQKVDRLRQDFKRLTNQEKNQFLFWLGLSSQEASERFSERKIYECLKSSLSKLSAAGDLQFEAVKSGQTGEHFQKVVAKVNTAAETLQPNERERFLVKYCATAVGRLVVLDSPLQLPHLLRMIARHHEQIMGDLKRELSY
ncbi:hypothetical protein [Vibrio phage vB_VpS_CC6]|nr:hypothetical protein [Vibrio phage vB_VpS_CC6]